MTSNPASPPPITSPEARRTSFGRPSLIIPRSTGPLAIIPNTARARAHNTDGPWAYVPSFPGASLFLLCSCGAVSQIPRSQRAGTSWLTIQPPCHSTLSNRKIPAGLVFSLAWISNHQKPRILQP